MKGPCLAHAAGPRLAPYRTRLCPHLAVGLLCFALHGCCALCCSCLRLCLVLQLLPPFAFALVVPPVLPACIGCCGSPALLRSISI